MNPKLLNLKLSRKPIALTTILIIATIATVALATRKATAGGASGRFEWHVRTTVECAEPTCDGTGILPPWIKSLVNPFDAVSDADGNFTHTASIILVGRPGNPQRCDPTIFSQPFSGVCVVRDHGSGFIAPGGALPGVDDFWVATETATFNGGPQIVDPFAPYPIDTGELAQPGHYGTVDLLGFKPRGVLLDQVVTRRALP